jgi:FkbM family methyltransferase
MDLPDEPVSLEEVARWGYRLLLGRDIESEAMLAMWAALGSGPRIAEGLLASDEAFQLGLLGFPVHGDWIAGPVTATAMRAAQRLRHDGLGPATEPPPDLHSLRAALLASPEIAAMIAHPHGPAGEARFRLLDRDFTLRGPHRDSYFRALAETGPDPAAERLARIARAMARVMASAAGAVAVDAGANLGLTCLAIAAAWPDHAAIHAFEPDRRTASLLAANMAANGLERVRVHAVALGATEGEASFRRMEGNPATSHLLPPGSRSGARAGELRQVPVRTLDAMLDLPRLDLLKIDVEGAEALVLAGGAATLARHRPLVVAEFNLWTQMVIAGRNPVDVLEEWRAAWPFLCAFDREGRPFPLHDTEGTLWLLYEVQTRRHGLDDVILCHDLDWLAAWT